MEVEAARLLAAGIAIGFGAIGSGIGEGKSPFPRIVK